MAGALYVPCRKEISACKCLLALVTASDERLLNAAVAVLAKRGYDGATTREIADLAGVNEVTLFRRFRSKENLVEAVLARNRDRSLQALESVLSAEADSEPAACLRKVGRKLTHSAEADSDFLVLVVAEARRKKGVAKARSSLVRAVVRRLGKYFGDQVRRGSLREVDPEAAALTFLSFLVYTSLLRGVTPDIAGGGEKALDEFIDIFVRGIAGERNPATPRGRRKDRGRRAIRPSVRARGSRAQVPVSY